MDDNTGFLDKYLPRLKKTARLLANSVLKKFGAEIVPLNSLGSQNTFQGEKSLPPQARDYLRRDNPRLAELKRRYVNHPAAKHSLWADVALGRDLRLEYFRADNAYIYQRRWGSDAAYALTAQYVQSHDELGLLKELKDDALFGNCLVNLDDHTFVSRDLLDSVLEINFLYRQLKLSYQPSFSVWDVGAGYGRLAHRLVEALPNLKRILCTDAVAESTFISDFYLKFRNVQHKAQVVPLDEIEAALKNSSIELMTNIHSFGECTFDSIVWWLDLLEATQTRFMFIVANGDGLGSTEVDRSNIDYLPSILERGYRLKVKEPKYVDSASVQKHGLYPTYYYLFERT